MESLLISGSQGLGPYAMSPSFPISVLLHFDHFKHPVHDQVELELKEEEEGRWPPS